MVRLEKWVHPEFVQGIASGARVPLKGAAVLRVTLLEGKTAEGARAGPEIFVRCKIAARGSSDGHGLILGGRALDCAAGWARMGLGFRPGPEHHVLDTLSIKIPRCEDFSRVRKDRPAPTVALLYSLAAALAVLPATAGGETAGGGSGGNGVPPQRRTSEGELQTLSALALCLPPRARMSSPIAWISFWTSQHRRHPLP